MQALGVGTGSELGTESTGVGGLREMLHGSSLIACGVLFVPGIHPTHLRHPA
jgi:hypothetical protein